MVDTCEISYNENEDIEKLRIRVRDVLTGQMYDDTLLFYRFLKARNFDVDEAEKMLRKHMIWRKLNQVDTILEDFKPMEFFTRYIDPTLLGFCKEGSLIVYCPPGKLDMKEVLKCSEFNRYMRHFVWASEKFMRSIKQENDISGRNVHKITIILDMDKLTFANATNKSSADEMLGLTNLLQNNYPEYMKAVYVINDGWKEKLLKEIDANVLPAFLGGNRTDPDGNPLCKTFVNHGGTFSSEYFLSDEERYFKNRRGVKKVTVLKMEKKEISLEVEEEGSVIRWEFYCKSNINFGLYRELSQQNTEEIIPLTKYDTSDGTEKNCYKVRIPGKYILVFDNSFSWMTSKEVEYCFEVLKSES